MSKDSGRFLFGCILSAAFLIISACGGGGSAPQPPQPGTGQLAVTISGLPQGTSAAVSVSGPGGFFQGLTTTQTLNGAAVGTYTIAASSVPASERVFAPSPASQTATVASGQLTSVSVVYAATPITVSVAPPQVNLQTGANQAFTATVSGTTNGSVAWSVVEVGGGAVTSGGLYTAPAVAGTYHVRATSTADPTASGQATATVTHPTSVFRILYIHHSTGGNVWDGGVPEWIEAYNLAHGTTYQITERSFPDSPYPWDNYPYDYWNLWVNHSGGNTAQGQDTLETLTGTYDLIIFKHCFPVSEIEADTGSPDVGSSDRTQENYKLQYTALKAKLRQFPAKRFLLWTGAAHVQSATTPAAAQRTREFFTWVKGSWDEPGDNIFLWDFYELETEGGLYLKDAHSVGGGDSHPGETFCRTVAPFFGRRLVNILEGRGDSTRLDGKD